MVCVDWDCLLLAEWSLIPISLHSPALRDVRSALSTLSVSTSATYLHPQKNPIGNSSHSQFTNETVGQHPTAILQLLSDKSGVQRKSLSLRISPLSLLGQLKTSGHKRLCCCWENKPIQGFGRNVIQLSVCHGELMSSGLWDSTWDYCLKSESLQGVLQEFEAFFKKCKGMWAPRSPSCTPWVNFLPVASWNWGEVSSGSQWLSGPLRAFLNHETYL